MSDMINLVNTNGDRVGSIEKLEAHEKGLLHEAFSVFIFNKNHELLLQRRALEKYHSGGLWTNTCCSHARVGEDINDAVHRRLVEEMGFDTDMHQIGNFIYKVDLDHGLMEHEYDHVFVGEIDYDVNIKPNPEEVCEYKWISLDDLKKNVIENPAEYTEWIKIILRDELIK